MLLRALTFALFLSASCLPQTVRAADDPIMAIPDSVSVVIRLKSPDTTIQKLVTFANEVSPIMGVPLQQASQGLGVLISNPTTAGVDRQKDWWITVFASGGGEPTIAFLIPATDADAAKEAVGDSFHYVTHDDWLLYSKDEATAKMLEARLGGEGKSIAGTVDEASLKVLDGGDLSVFVNVTQLATAYKSELEAADGQIDELMENIAQLSATNPSGIDLEAVFKIYGEIGHGAMQAVKDAKSFSLAVAFEKKQIGIEEYITFNSGTPAAKFLSSHTSSEMALINQLPENQLGYFGMHGDMSHMMKFGMEMSASMFKDGDEEKLKAIKEITAEFEKLKIDTVAGSMNFAKLEGGALRGVFVTETSDPQKMKEISRKVTKAMGTMELPGMKQEMTLKPDAEKVNGVSIDIINLTQEIDESLDPIGIQSAVMEAMYGPDGVTTRVAYLKDRVAQTMGGGLDSMSGLLDRLNNTSATVENKTSAARKHLTPKSNLVVLVDLPGLLVKVVSLVVETGQVPIPLTTDMLQTLESEPSYIGFSLATEKQAVRMKTNIPIEQVQALFKLGVFVQQMLQQPQL